MVRWLNACLPQERVDQAFETLDRLHRVMRVDKLVAFYEEKGQELDRVLQIFIRLNDGGTVLSHSDLLLSIAVAQWTNHDAREEIHRLVDDLNPIGAGFSFSKDLVLKAGLMLSDIGSVGFRVDNFNRVNMGVFEAKWNDIKQSLSLTVQLISSFGFDSHRLRAQNAILPIAYYLHQLNPGEGYLTAKKHEQDRFAIREWLVRSLLKSGIWGSGLDTLLTALRKVLRESESTFFPVVLIGDEMARRGRSLVFEDEEVEDLVDMRYRDSRTFALLSMIFPFVDLRNNYFHVDHIFPAGRFSKAQLRTAGVSDEKRDRFIRLKDGLPNLQLLPGIENMSKRAMLPAEWLEQQYPELGPRREYKDRHLLGKVPACITGFDKFYDERRERLKIRIQELLGR